MDTRRELNTKYIHLDCWDESREGYPIDDILNGDLNFDRLEYGIYRMRGITEYYAELFADIQRKLDDDEISSAEAHEYFIMVFNNMQNELLAMSKRELCGEGELYVLK